VTAMPTRLPRRVILLGCVGQKLDRPAPAKDLYTSPLWRKRRAYAEASGCPWAILSAAHGLVMPDEELRPYDVTLNTFRLREREAWAGRVAMGLRHHFGPLVAGDVFEVHAGEKYLDGLWWEIRRVLHAELEAPLRGLKIGEQLAWYGAHP
jgi:Family of unknown function (DUF6884)